MYIQIYIYIYYTNIYIQYIYIWTNYKHVLPTARKPAQRFCVFLHCDIFFGGGVVGWGGVITSSLRYDRSSSVNTLHATLYTSVALRWTHFMLRCTLLLYFGEHASCYIVHFVVLRWTRFMLRCTLLLHFGKHASCYVVHFCCTSVSTLHVRL